MSGNKKMPSALVSLVGANPYPIYLGVRQFAEQGTAIVLVHSDETADQAERIKSVLTKEDFAGSAIDLQRLHSAHDPKQVREGLTDVMNKYANSWVNFTGGTKIMSAYGLMLWREADLPAFYIAEETQQIFFDSGEERTLGDHQYSIDTLCKLHEVVVGKPESGIKASAGELDDIFERRNNVGCRMSALRREDEEVKDWKKLSGDKFESKLQVLRDLKPDGMSFDVSKPTSNTSYKEGEYKKFSDFLGGLWFEQWLQLKVKAADQNIEWTRGQKFKIDKQEFESDLMAIARHRLRYISVTTDRGEKLIKGKVFEAVHRAHQIGGGMASVAVVCLATDDVRDKARMSVGASPSGKLQVFGDSDVEEWGNGNVETLSNFLSN